VRIKKGTLQKDVLSCKTHRFGLAVNTIREVMEGPLCFCGKKVKNLDGRMIYCGTTVDYKALSEADRIKDLLSREANLKQLDLGCNMKTNEKDLKSVYKAFNGNLPKMKQFPVCYHNLWTKLCVSHSKQNDGRPFFACAVPFPNFTCGYFKWCKDFFENKEQTAAAQDSPPPPPPQKKIKTDDETKVQLENKEPGWWTL